ncbi:hypothetical protein KK083_19110 [Fulvivirgaceae bacterium PWU4]|uniref:RHS repeat-associated core domain-containing protein n=1 Tax=Chryseosolibacter histidini TaxID=2782349 RepID=A0AAP2DQ99_9BACT|nr:RHS repeat-associated core domain-containing protein [Chryseosolibacter histidini]MBT1699012.1 hypothetical protein [Chryseosolibacter histidini]
METFFRSYDPVLGRFMQVDPMASVTHTLSPYQYADGNPVLFNDPSGLLRAPRDLHSMDWSGWTDYLGGGGGSADFDWAAQYRSMESNYAIMSEKDFRKYYGLEDLSWNGDFGYNEDGEFGYWTNANYLDENGAAVVNTIFIPVGDLAQQGGPGEEAHNSLYTLRSDYTRMKHLLGEFLSGEGPERSLFYGSHLLTKGMMNSAVVKRAKEWYAANGNGQDMVRRHFDFFATDVPFVSSDIEQFVGSARVSIYPRDGLTLFVIDHTTGRYLGGFDSVPDIYRVPGQITPTGNIYQRFIWIEWK